MKGKTKFIQLTGIVMLLIVAMIGCKENTATPEELSQMNKDFAKALNDKDAEAASLLPPNEPIVTERENIKKYWQGALDAGTTNVSVSTISTGSNGDLGYEIGRFELSYPGPDGKLIVEKGKYTELLKRTTDGKWISIYGIWNSDPHSSE